MTAKVDAIVNAMRAVPGVYLLARESDADHNRSVVTLAGEPEAVREAVVLGAGKAAEVIDLTRQTGAHPRIGATDVVPFIPIDGVTIDDCVKLAHEAAQEIWNRYQIPVYLYEAAAQWPERTNLENIRRGQFEGLREEVQRNPQRAPDFGEPRLHPTAGATVVGARKFLIAYNINLNTADLDIAKRIAKTIRFSSGGMPCVKAMGVDLRARHLAQVSMNLTDFEQTGVHTVFERVRTEAERLGVGIVGSEIVGLIPRRAIEMTAEHFLKVENFSSAQVLENRLEESLAEAAKSHASLAALAQPFIDAVATPTPLPAADRWPHWLDSARSGSTSGRWLPEFPARRNRWQPMPRSSSRSRRSCSRPQRLWPRESIVTRRRSIPCWRPTGFRATLPKHRAAVTARSRRRWWAP